MSPAASAAPSTSRAVRLISSRFYYGWVIAAMGFIAQMLTSLSSQGLATYVAPLQREFGWSSAETAAGRSFQQTDAFLGPVNGWLVDRFGPRRMMSIGVVLYAVSFIAFSRVETMWQYYGACVLMALSNSFVGLLIVSYSLNQWFRRRRTTAIGISSMGLAAAGAIFIPAIVWGQSFGWRTAAFGTAIGMLILGSPIVLLMRDSPEKFGLLPDGEASRPRDRTSGQAARDRLVGLPGFSLTQAVRTRAFWCIALGMTFANASQSAVVVHQFAHLEQLLSRETAAFVLSMLNVFNLGGRLFGGLLGDRLPKHQLLGSNLLVATTSLLLLAFASSLPLLLLYGACFGFSWGLRTAVANSITGDYFGRVAFGRVAGLIQLLASPASILSPIVAGLVADAVGSYRIVFLALASVTITASVLFFLARRPADPRRTAGSQP
ncbi:MAG: MFS transporter [Chloroflexi bacterium]|nr:MFS transporter [Chloroflexota bacterium]